MFAPHRLQVKSPPVSRYGLPSVRRLLPLSAGLWKVDRACSRACAMALASSSVMMAGWAEFDPERTPEVIFRHRSISRKSLIHWWKDHHVSLVQEGSSFTLVARPPNAQIHRAAELMADDIDRELALCRRLADETHFENCPGMAGKLRHSWPFASSVRRRFEPRGAAYEYINGAFRPDTMKLLSLLSGLQLYGTEMAAVRELLQNAFDAVREEISYKRLAALAGRQADPGKELAKQHYVTLELKRDGDSVLLVCTDDGVGMTKRIITDHLLVSGAARRHSILDLERRCLEKGFLLGRTGEFGIGVLSYFMLGDHLEFTTRRSQSAGDDEGHGWSFVTDGVGSFGELRRHAQAGSGTQTCITLRDEMTDSELRTFGAKVVEYISSHFSHIPCTFSFTYGTADGESLSLEPGWCVRDDRAAGFTVHMLGPRSAIASSRSSDDLLSPEERQVLASADHRSEELIGKARSAL